MTSFNDRERAAESKFAHDEELLFKAHARRDRKLGLWAAKLLGKSDAEAAAYADSLVAAEVSMGEAGALAATVSADLAKGGQPQASAMVATKMEEFLAASLAELKSPA